MLKTLSPLVVGIHRDKEGWKVAVLQKKQKEISLVSLKTLPYLEGKPLPLQDHVPPPFSLVSGIETGEMVRREVKTYLKKDRDLSKTLPFQLESLFPFPSEETFVLPFPEQEKVVAFATQKKSLLAHIAEWKEMGFDLQGLSSVPMALFRWQQFLFPDI